MHCLLPCATHQGASLTRVLHQHPAGGNHFFTFLSQFLLCYSLLVPSTAPIFERFICPVLQWHSEAVNYFRHFSCPFSLALWALSHLTASCEVLHWHHFYSPMPGLSTPSCNYSKQLSCQFDLFFGLGGWLVGWIRWCRFRSCCRGPIRIRRFGAC